MGTRLLKDAIYVGTALIDMYVECGCITKAHQVFDELSVQDVTAWNVLISGYTENGHGQKALECFEKMKHQGVSPNAITFVNTLRACASIRDSDKGEEIHSEIERKGLISRNPYIRSSLVAMYAKCGLLSKAQKVFDSLPIRDVVSWTALISGYTEHGHDKESLKCFEKMKFEGVSANAATFVSTLKACANIGDANTGSEIHDQIEREGLLDRNIFVGSALVDMYVKCGLTTKAQLVFDKLPARNVIVWTSLIAGYAEHGEGEKALECFEQMQEQGISPNAITFVSALKACCNIGAIDIGQEIHAMVERKGLLEKNLFVGSTLVDMYAKCGLLWKAQEVFDKLQCQDIVSWNALITGYAKHGCTLEVLECYERMQLEGVCSNSITFICSLKACGATKALQKGREIHCQVRRKGLLATDSNVGSTLIDMYAMFGLLTNGREVFNEIQNQDVVCWTSLISGYVEHGYGEEALGFYEEMQLKNVIPDPVTVIGGLKACSSIGLIEKGIEIHAEIERRSLLGTNVVLGSILVDMYMKCGLVTKAQQVFDKLPIRDVVSWTTLIAGYTDHGYGEEALLCYEQMQLQGILPNAVTFISILRACGSIGAIEKGQEIHTELERKGFLEQNNLVGSTLVDMYAKCGSVSIARQVFERLPDRDTVSWNSLISGYAQLGESEYFVHIVDRMLGEGIRPDSVTLLVVLNACSRSGMFTSSQTYFEVMSKDYGVIVTPEHHACMVNLLGHAGHVDRAMAMMNKMPFCPTLPAWRAVLGACRNSGSIELAKQAFEHAMHLDETHSASYVLMSQIYMQE